MLGVFIIDAFVNKYILIFLSYIKNKTFMPISKNITLTFIVTNRGGARFDFNYC
ncbi:MAG: hypothetical protein RA159_01985 [Arsenophonus sp.]|nr:MAG: hypothetical protein RA159_01985 [Arsenophonus sp.]